MFKILSGIIDAKTSKRKKRERKIDRPEMRKMLKWKNNNLHLMYLRINRVINL